MPHTLALLPALFGNGCKFLLAGGQRGVHGVADGDPERSKKRLGKLVKHKPVEKPEH